LLGAHGAPLTLPPEEVGAYDAPGWVGADVAGEEDLVGGGIDTSGIASGHGELSVESSPAAGGGGGGGGWGDRRRQNLETSFLTRLSRGAHKAGAVLSRAMEAPVLAALRCTMPDLGRGLRSSTSQLNLSRF